MRGGKKGAGTKYVPNKDIKNSEQLDESILDEDPTIDANSALDVAAAQANALKDYTIPRLAGAQGPKTPEGEPVTERRHPTPGPPAPAPGISAAADPTAASNPVYSIDLKTLHHLLTRGQVGKGAADGEGLAAFLQGIENPHKRPHSPVDRRGGDLERLRYDVVGNLDKMRRIVKEDAPEFAAMLAAAAEGIRCGCRSFCEKRLGPGVSATTSRR